MLQNLSPLPRKYKKPPPKSIESTEDRSISSDWVPIVSSGRYALLPQVVSRPPAAEKTTKSAAADVTTAAPKPKPAPSIYQNNLNRISHMNYFTYQVRQNLSAQPSQMQELRQKFPDRGRIPKKPVPKKVPDGGYQVHEEVEEDVKTPRPTNFNVLSPSVFKSVPLYPALGVDDNRISDQGVENSSVLPPPSVLYGKRSKPKDINEQSTSKP